MTPDKALGRCKYWLAQAAVECQRMGSSNNLTSFSHSSRLKVWGYGVFRLGLCWDLSPWFADGCPLPESALAFSLWLCTPYTLSLLYLGHQSYWIRNHFRDSHLQISSYRRLKVSIRIWGWVGYSFLAFWQRLSEIFGWETNSVLNSGHTQLRHSTSCSQPTCPFSLLIQTSTAAKFLSMDELFRSY